MPALPHLFYHYFPFFATLITTVTTTIASFNLGFFLLPYSLDFAIVSAFRPLTPFSYFPLMQKAVRGRQPYFPNSRS